ncbi:hypothetical protein KIL84_011484 [Mauremys mutica]|uniref:Uncharacterized protein n=1 Tax=Mauremys mutica TaxID=74926 RepID=A0A9D3XDU3_9SAUR|nr:hypothetical protein KIL84_011484 [Mauremys mutica]
MHLRATGPYPTRCWLLLNGAECPHLPLNSIETERTQHRVRSIPAGRQGADGLGMKVIHGGGVESPRVLSSTNKSEIYQALKELSTKAQTLNQLSPFLSHVIGMKLH